LVIERTKCRPGQRAIIRWVTASRRGIPASRITENGRRRKITKREAVIKQLVNKSASADPRSLKILLDLMLNLEAWARSSAVPAPAVGPADEEVFGAAQGEARGRHPGRNRDRETMPPRVRPRCR
jgi:hypothetical protein